MEIQSSLKEEQLEKAMPAETRKRSLAKTISWRCVGTIDTIVLSYIITGSVKMATSIGIFELFTKIMLFYFHERAWSLVSWGKVLKKS